VALYISKSLKSIPRSDITLGMPLVESVWVEIVPSHNKKSILVGCIYKHPGANIDESLMWQLSNLTLISISYISLVI